MSLYLETREANGVNEYSTVDPGGALSEGEGMAQMPKNSTGANLGFEDRLWAEVSLPAKAKLDHALRKGRFSATAADGIDRLCPVVPTHQLNNRALDTRPPA